MKSNKSFQKNLSRAVLFTALFLCFLASNINAQKMFELKGKAVGLNNAKIVLFGIPELRTQDTLGVSAVKNNKFSFKGKIANPMMARLFFPESNRYASFWIMPGTVEVDLDTAKVSVNYAKELVPVVRGSSEQLVYDQFYAKTRSLSAVLEEESKKLKSITDPEEKKKQEEKVSELREEYTTNSNKFNWEFAKEHNNSFAACFILSYAMNDYYQPVEKLQSVMNNFSENVKKSLSYKKNLEELNAMLSIQPGKTAPEFTAKDPEGKDLSLSSLKGKVVLLDFWASWCIPCIASIPSMKELYNAYKEKGFEILGVSDDSKEDAWKKCIQQNSIPWKNVIDRFPIKYRPAEICTLYSIHFLPTTILLDKNGIIAAKNLHGKELEEKVKELLK